MGFKTEGDSALIIAQNNALTEIIGGMIYANKNHRPYKQWIFNHESALSLSLTENVIRKEPFDPVVDIRDGQTKVFTKGIAPNRGGSQVVLYTIYEFQADRAPAAPTDVKTEAQASKIDFS